MIGKCVFYMTMVLVGLSLVYPIAKIYCGAKGGKIILGEDGPTSLFVELPDKAPMAVHYIMLIGGLAYIVAGIILALSVHKA